MQPEPSNPPAPRRSDFDPGGTGRTAVVFRERARKYAVPRAALRPQRVMEVLRFSVGNSRYAFPLAQVVEVGPLPGLTLVPGGPPELAGVVNVRGEIVCALDLQRTVGLPVPATPPPAGSLLLMRTRSRLVGLPVTSLTGVAPCDPEALLPLQGLDLAAAPFALGMLDDGALLLAWLKIIRLPLFDAL